MISEIVLLIILIAVLLLISVYFFRKDRSFLKKKTKESLGLDVRRELSQERKESKVKRDLFLSELEKAQSDGVKER